MNDDLETTVLRVRMDTDAFSREVAAMRQQLDGSLTSGAQKAGGAIEGALVRALKRGQVGFDDFRKVALDVLGEIAARALRTQLAPQPALPTGGGLNPLLGAARALLGGAAGRATGGPVSAGRAYTVGERGPELFVPSADGRIVAAAPAAPRVFNINVSVSGDARASSGALNKTAQQMARQIRSVLDQAD